MSGSPDGRRRKRSRSSDDEESDEENKQSTPKRRLFSPEKSDSTDVSGSDIPSTSRGPPDQISPPAAAGSRQYPGRKSSERIRSPEFRTPLSTLSPLGYSPDLGDTDARRAISGEPYVTGEPPGERIGDQQRHKRSRSAEFAYERRLDDVRTRNFACRLHRLISVIRFHFWNRQCQIAFSPLISQGESLYLTNESLTVYTATLTSVHQFIVESNFLNNLILLHRSPSIQQNVMSDYETLLAKFRSAQERKTFIYPADSRGAYGSKVPSRTIKRRESMENLIVSDQLLGMREVVDGLHHLLGEESPDIRQAYLQRLRHMIARLIDHARTRLRILDVNLDYNIPAPNVTVNREETRSILRPSGRASSGRRISVGPIRRRFLYLDENEREDEIDDSVYQTIEDYQQRRARERMIWHEMQRLRMLNARRVQQMLQQQGRPVPRFRQLRLSSGGKRPVNKHPDIEELTRDYPNERTFLRLTPPKDDETEEEGVEAEDEETEDDGKPENEEGHNIFDSPISYFIRNERYLNGQPSLTKRFRSSGL